MRRFVAAGGLLAAIVAIAALAATPASAATLPTPTDVTATAQPNGALVNFTEPAFPASSQFYYYTVTASPGGLTAKVGTNGGSAPTPIGFGDLTNGVTYTFTVTVTDDAGDTSAPSAPSNAVTPELTVPDAPIDLRVSASDSQASVSFDTDGNDGGTTINSFTVTAFPGGAHASGASSPVTVTGLTDGTSYTFTVTAANSVGSSAPSAPTAAVTPLAIPMNTTAPTITGDPQVGETVQATIGVWTQSPYDYTFVWYDCSPADPTSCTAISPSATGQSYTVAPDDVGSTLEVSVAALNADGETATVTTAPTDTVIALSTPVASGPPSVSGAALVGDAVHASTGTWTNVPTAFTYQWFDCDPVNGTNCVAIDGATRADYTVTPEDGDSTLEVAVTATNLASLSATSMSSPTATVTARPGAPTVTALPTIGSVDGGEPVSGTQGSWSNGPTSFTYTWVSCLPDFSTCYFDTDPSSTLSSYSPTTSDSGDVLLLEVVATNAVGDSVAALSDPSAPVSFPPPTISVVFPVNGGTYLQSRVAGVPPQATCTPALGTQLSDCEDTLGLTSGNLPSTLGTDSFQVFAEDDDGGQATTTVTYTVTGPSSSTALTPFVPGTLFPAPPRTTGLVIEPAAVAPSISALTESSARWRAAAALPNTQSGSPAAKPAKGTDFSFNSSAAGQLQFIFRREQPGRRNGSRCVAPTHANRHRAPCVRTGSAATLTIEASAGANYVSFDGVLSAAKRLTPGAYSVVVVVVRSVQVVSTMHFTIVK